VRITQMFKSAYVVRQIGDKKLRSTLSNMLGSYLKKSKTNTVSTPIYSSPPNLTAQNPFWHYQCSFDALKTMSKYAASDVAPTEGYLTNYLGVKIDPLFFPTILDGKDNTIESMPQPNNWHADIAEFAAALRAVDLSGSTFTVLELGCGWGCWLNNTGAAARRAGKKVKLLGIEGDAGHVEFANQSLKTNEFLSSEYSIMHGIAAATKGSALFPKQSAAGVQWGLEPVFGASDKQIAKALSEGTHDKLEMIALSDIIIENGKLDLLHIDIQGGEDDLLRDSIETCNSSVSYIVIGTHSRFIEGTLEKLMFNNDWVLEVDRPAISSLENGVQTLRVDGVQGWRNRRIKI
jgi:FkbM family methyltransferase